MMMRRISSRSLTFSEFVLNCFSVLIFAGIVGVPSMALAEGAISPEHAAFFEERIRPVLVNNCYECHASDAVEISGDYTLDSREGLRAGGASGEKALIPGQPEKSRLMKALRHEEITLAMPPTEKLPDNIIADFEKWIAMGAPDPRTEDAKKLRQAAQAKKAGQHWAFQRPVKPAIPEVKQTEWPESEIDRFVLSRMEQEGLEPTVDASPPALLRRVYFDLTGLPPSPEEIEAFTQNPSPGAYRKIVDSLLDSPQFGERWGRHWLDLARYAESSGMEFNFTYPHAWPYRDYVIQAFNEDKPYDRFLTEQLAGDLLPAETEEERDENRLATGFLAVGPKRHNAGTTTFRMDMVDDQIKATSKTFMGITTGCARCHDHKFDPIPTEDYYAMAGIFLSTDTLYGTVKKKYSRHPSDLIPFGKGAQQQHEKYEEYKNALAKAEDRVEKAEKSVKKLKEKLKEKDKEKTEKTKKDEPEKKSKEDTNKEEKKQEDSKKPALEDQLKSAQSKLDEAKEALKKLKDNKVEPPQYAMGARDGDVSDTHVAVGGDPGNKGEEVPRGCLTAVPVNYDLNISDKSSGRLELARWLTDPSHPLTSRVMVNRLWHHLFGRGIVSTVNNFGILGEKPSHPELLDYLARTFVEDDKWSMKQMIRRIVLSRTYQLSTRKLPKNQEIDPRNIYLWRMSPKRLEVEPLRDAILAASGQLDRSPIQGSSVTQLGQQLARGVDYDKINPDSHHRSVYQPVVRHYVPYMFQDFDFAAPSLVVGKRAETTTPQQALFMMNGKFIIEQSRNLAEDLLKQHSNEQGTRIRQAYLRTVNRPPTPDELSRAEKFLEQADQHLTEKYTEKVKREQMVLASFCQVLLCSAEFRYLLEPPAAAHNHPATAKK